MMLAISLLALLACAVWATLADDPGNPQLARVDAQVFNGRQVAIPALQRSDFELHVDGKIKPILSLESDSAAVDVLFLLDISAEMKPQTQQLADMIGQALRALTAQDRVSIMVFDVNARPHLPLTLDRGEVTQDLNRIIAVERFVGGARITSSLIAAAAYLQRHARPDARRAIVILTRNSTQDSEDETRVLNALQRADATLSFLFAAEKKKPVDEDGDAIPGQGSRGRRKANPGAPQVRHGAPPSPEHSAGAEAVAQDAGGDAAPFDDEFILEDTLLHLRQRYILRFDLPQETSGKSEPTPHKISLDLSSQTRARLPEAAVHFRLLYTPGAGLEETISPLDAGPPEDAHTSQPAAKRRGKAVNEGDAKSGPPEGN